MTAVGIRLMIFWRASHCARERDYLQVHSPSQHTQVKLIQETCFLRIHLVLNTARG